MINQSLGSSEEGGNINSETNERALQKKMEDPSIHLPVKDIREDKTDVRSYGQREEIYWTWLQDFDCWGIQPELHWIFKEHTLTRFY